MQATEPYDAQKGYQTNLALIDTVQEEGSLQVEQMTCRGESEEFMPGMRMNQCLHLHMSALNGK